MLNISGSLVAQTQQVADHLNNCYSNIASHIGNDIKTQCITCINYGATDYVVVADECAYMYAIHRSTVKLNSCHTPAVNFTFSKMDDEHIKCMFLHFDIGKLLV